MILMPSSLTTSILDLPRAKFKDMEYVNDTQGTRFVRINIDADKRYKPRCSNCGSPAPINRNGSREARDSGAFGHIVYLRFEQREVNCPNCGIRIEKLEFISPGARATKRFEEQVAYLCRYMTLSDVAAYFNLDWKTVKRIDKEYLLRTFEEISLDGLTLIGFDEVARAKGHDYLTCVFDLRNNRLIRVLQGRKESSVAKFYRELGPERCKKIQAIAMDMWGAFIKATRKYCPQAKIVFDKFHVIANYHKIIDQIRRTEFRRAESEEQELIKGSRYLLLKNRSKLSEAKEQRLLDLLAVNENLNISYALKEQLQTLWDSPTVPQFNNAMDQWCQLARESGIPQLAKFAASLERHRSGLWTYCLYPINTARLEANNANIALLRRKAKGFRDIEYFILKIHQASA